MARPFGVVRAPQADALGLAAREPLERSGKIGLRGDAQDLRQVREPREAVLIPRADHRLAPRRHEHAQLVGRGSRAEPVTEALPRGAIAIECGAIVLALRERAVLATVVTAGERAAIQDVELHDSSKSFMRARTSSEYSHGPIASARASPSGVSWIEARRRGREPAWRELLELGKIGERGHTEPGRVRGEIDAVVGQQRQDQPAPALLAGVEHEAVVGAAEPGIAALHPAIDDVADAARADRPLARVVHAARVRPRATAEPDHAVVLAAVHRRCGRGAAAEHAQRDLAITGREQRGTRLFVEVDPRGVDRLGAFATERGQRPHVQRIEVDLLGLVLERLRQRRVPRRGRLAGQAVHQVDVERRHAGVADRAQRAVDLGGVCGD